MESEGQALQLGRMWIGTESGAVDNLSKQSNNKKDIPGGEAYTYTYWYRISFAFRPKIQLFLNCSKKKWE